MAHKEWMLWNLKNQTKPNQTHASSMGRAQVCEPLFSLQGDTVQFNRHFINLVCLKGFILIYSLYVLMYTDHKRRVECCWQIYALPLNSSTIKIKRSCRNFRWSSSHNPRGRHTLIAVTTNKLAYFCTPYEWTLQYAQPSLSSRDKFILGPVRCQIRGLWSSRWKVTHYFS